MLVNPRAEVVFGSPNSVNPLEKVAAELEKQVEQHRVERKQERFFFVFAITALLNVHVIDKFAWLAALTFLLFSLVLVVG